MRLRPVDGVVDPAARLLHADPSPLGLFFGFLDLLQRTDRGERVCEREKEQKKGSSSRGRGLSRSSEKKKKKKKKKKTHTFRFDFSSSSTSSPSFFYPPLAPRALRSTLTIAARKPSVQTRAKTRLPPRSGDVFFFSSSSSSFAADDDNNIKINVESSWPEPQQT